MSSNPTKPASKVATIEVPSEYEEEIKKYLQSLSLNKNNTSDKQTSSFMSNDDDIDEVSQIRDHKIVKDIWYFQVKFKSSNTLQWIADSDCFCEELISEYLSRKTINTIYCFCRVSSINQVGDNHCSLDAQESEIKSNVANTSNKRFKVIRIAASAYKNIPKDFYNIGQSCHKGDEIIIYRVDRFGRNIVKYLSWMEELNNRGVKLISYVDKISYEDNKLEFIQKILDANKESKLLSERIKMSLKRRQDRGDEALGKLPYGKKYQRLTTGADTKLVVVDDIRSVSIIKKINQMTISHRKIAEKLNNDGVYKYNRKWTPQMIKHIRQKFKGVV